MGVAHMLKATAMIRYEQFRLALSRLERQHLNYQSADAALAEIMRDAIKESVIKRFETCYEMLWRTLRRHLVVILGNTNVPNSPKPVFRVANENDLLPSPVERWLSYANSRIDTAHDYSGEKAGNCIGMMGEFVGDAIGLYEILTGNRWKQSND